MIERFWRAKLIKDGPFIGVCTFFAGPLVDGEILDRSPRWQAIVADETFARVILMGENGCPIEVDGKFLRNIEGVREPEYRHLIAHAAWAKQYAPHLPDARPEKPIDWMETPI